MICRTRVPFCQSKKRFCRTICLSKTDVVLSSGFMAFASHAGFLQALVDAEVDVQGVMGTSSGAYAGSLFCAGYTPLQIAEELTKIPPYKLMSPSLTPWRGGWISLDGVIKRLQDLLPPTFEDLERDFACAVVDYKGNYMIVDSGPLPEAIAASGAIPIVFHPVDIPGLNGTGPYFDGGVIDRVGLKIWRDRIRNKSSVQETNHAFVHIVEKTTLSGNDDLSKVGESKWSVVKSRKSGKGFYDISGYEQMFLNAQTKTEKILKKIEQDGYQTP